MWPRGSELHGNSSKSPFIYQRSRSFRAVVSILIECLTPVNYPAGLLVRPNYSLAKLCLQVHYQPGRRPMSNPNYSMFFDTERPPFDFNEEGQIIGASSVQWEVVGSWWKRSTFWFNLIALTQLFTEIKSLQEFCRCQLMNFRKCFWGDALLNICSRCVLCYPFPNFT